MTSLHALRPERVCLLRLSALGDTCHVIALLRILQRAWPEARFTWVVGRSEARLISLLDDVEVIPIDKRAGWGGLRQLRERLKGRSFDLLLHLQTAVRASAMATQIRAPIKLGFDRARARELQWLVTNARIAPRSHEHVLEGLLGFAEALGIRDRALRWDVPLPESAGQYARQLLPDGVRSMIISPCASRSVRNWRPERYAAVADHAVERHGLRVILCGGPSPTEREMGAAIASETRVPVLNQIGQDTVPQLLALLQRATVLLTPDSGPAHLATMVGTPVLGLYASTHPGRTGPYLSQHYRIDRFAAAAAKYRGRRADQLPWTEKIEEPGVMDLIEVADVTAMLDNIIERTS